MKILKRVILSIIILAVISVGGFFLVKRIQEQRITTLVKNGQIVVDEEFHTWFPSKTVDSNPLTIKIYLRNKSKYRVVGNLVFSGTLSQEGLEEHFINRVINIQGEESIKKELQEEIEKGQITGRGQAIYDYINRGKKLPQGKDYEPVNYEKPQENYVFKFRKYCSLNAGEVICFTSEQIVPMGVAGCLLTVKVEGVEF